jgi:hypothetical protein
MNRKGISGRTRKLAIGGAAAALLAGAFAVSTGMSSAAESCVGLDQALQNNLNFIAGQQANPDALSNARIANRQAVVDLIEQRRATAGCTGNVQAGNGGAAAGNGNAGNGNAGKGNAGKGNAGKGNAGKGNAANANGNNGNANGNQGNGNGKGNNGNGNGNGGANAGGQQAANPPAANGDVVCAGSTVTVSGEGGAPAASSGTFPVGTTLRVTNRDNNKSTTVEVASVSGSCALLNNAAFEQVREPGKFLIRNATIEKIG